MRLLCPWDSPGKNTRVHCHAFPLETFLIQGSSPCLMFPALASRFFTVWATREALVFVASDQISSVAQSCPTLCDPMNRSTPGLPVQGSTHQIIFHCNSQKSRVWAGKHNWDTSKARHCLFNSSLAIVTSTEMYWPGTFVYPFVESGKKSKGFRYFVWLWV